MADTLIKALKDMAIELWCVSQSPYTQEWSEMSPDEIVDYFVREAQKELEKVYPQDFEQR